MGQTKLLMQGLCRASKPFRSRPDFTSRSFSRRPKTPTNKLLQLPCAGLFPNPLDPTNPKTTVKPGLCQRLQRPPESPINEAPPVEVQRRRESWSPDTALATSSISARQTSGPINGKSLGSRSHNWDFFQRRESAFL